MFGVVIQLLLIFNGKDVSCSQRVAMAVRSRECRSVDRAQERVMIGSYDQATNRSARMGNLRMVHFNCFESCDGRHDKQSNTGVSFRNGATVSGRHYSGERWFNQESKDGKESRA